MTPRCDNRVSNFPCNTPLLVTVLPTGRTRETCPRCEARAQGRCWQCGRPRTNHPEFGVYCEPCRKAAAKRSCKRAQQSPEYKAQNCRYHRERRKSDPAYVARQRENLRAWKQRNPEKVKANWQRFVERRKARRAAHQPMPQEGATP